LEKTFKHNNLLTPLCLSTLPDAGSIRQFGFRRNAPGLAHERSAGILPAVPMASSPSARRARPLPDGSPRRC